MNCDYVIYKEGTIARRHGDPLDPRGDDEPYRDSPRPRVFVRGREVVPADLPAPVLAVEWRPIPEFPGYEISAERRVRSLLRRAWDHRSAANFTPTELTIHANEAGTPVVTMKHADGKMRTRSVRKLFVEVFPELASMAAGDTTSTTASDVEAA